MNISSRKNESIKRYRALSRERKLRESEGMFTAEGVRLCLEAAENGIEIHSLFISESAMRRFPEAAEKLTAACSPACSSDSVNVITDELSEYISDTKTPQGVFITARIPDKAIDLESSQSRRLLILDDLQDTGNIGTVIRTCDALGIGGLILSENTADVYSPKTVRSAMGSLFRLPLIRAPLTSEIERLRAKGYSVYAAMLDKDAQRLDEIRFPEKAAVIIGNEGNGVCDEVKNAAGQSLYIPITGAESLNAAVAASIICWEMKK